MATFKFVLPVKGKKVRNDKFPHKPIHDTSPTKVLWNGYWQRRLKDKDVVLISEENSTAETVEVETTESDASVEQTEKVETDEIVSDDDGKKTKRSKKSK